MDLDQQEFGCTVRASVRVRLLMRSSSREREALLVFLLLCARPTCSGHVAGLSPASATRFSPLGTRHVEEYAEGAFIPGLHFELLAPVIRTSGSFAGASS
ncbi:hypothetical protein Mp_3g12480 [Marchantia polymorpha subsp. ruderalis]|uniref:Uncharacterized protein n=2 Tax=Marchantia polymorpha TaxID=3197 RepID=A0AAF6B033_MARPO|nr:hypothetical protein MARPO_0278s0007 [Marchantia polymorpha]PTQ38587.1 hypothetical protein MARPO_0050s0049 [Marchantia polymorpha]BBN05367.1 hypothetical protein Mp_3g12480 [Marchantia polymorpha subsp. ruderalis]|eukprot:PTQ26893.1 hypothetical protein MARPO_0278s0007 [Marchantia polymorpha]